MIMIEHSQAVIAARHWCMSLKKESIWIIIIMAHWPRQLQVTNVEKQWVCQS
jgi:hypothetical protein